jgi:hypothetical protein
MADGPDIKIGLKTVGDTTGADKVVDAIQEVPQAAEDAQRRLDVIEAKRRVAERSAAAEAKAAKAGGLSDEDLVRGVANAIPGGGRVTQLMSALGPEASAIAASALVTATTALAATIGSAGVMIATFRGELESLKEVEKLAKDAGIDMGETLRNEKAALEATVGWVDDLLEKWNDFSDAVAHPIDAITGLGALKDSLKQAAEMAGKLDKQRLEMANDRQGDLKNLYGEELSRLKEQESTIQRIAKLRAELGSIEQQRANNAVKIAEQDGGDVVLAQANALAVKIRMGMEKLGENLREAQSQVPLAEQQFAAAQMAYQDAIRDGLDKLDPAKFKVLSDAVGTTEKVLNDAKQAVTDQRQLFTQNKNLLIENAGIELRDLEEKVKDGVSRQAGKALDAIHNNLTESLSTESAAVQAVTGQVKAAIATDGAATVASIQTLAPQPQQTQAVVGAVQEVGKAQEQRDAAIISALATVAAGINGVTGKLAAQQSQINQLFARNR